MNLKLAGRAALVSGSTGDVGFTIAQSLAQRRTSVIINGRSEERIKQAIGKINAL